MNRRAINFLNKIDLNSGLQYWLLAVIMLLAAALRFYKLGTWSFWIDEIYTINHAQAHFSSLEKIIQHIPPHRNWVPVSVISTAGLMNLAGVSEWSARLAPTLIGILTIPALYFPVKRLFGVSVALMTVLLLAMSPWHLFWSQNARFLTALLLFYTLALFAFFFGLERDRPGYLLLFIGLTYLAASERLFALLLAPVVAAYLLLLAILPFEKPPGFRLRNLVLIVLPGIVFALIEVYSLVVGGASRFFGDFGVFLGNSIENPFGQAIFILFELGIPLVMLSLFSGLYLLAQKSRAGLFLTLGAIVPFALVILVTPFMFTEERYVFVSLPSWLILAALAVQGLLAQTRNYGKLLAIGVLVLLLADAAGTNLMYYRVNNGDRRDWRGAFALVQERSQEDDLVVSTWPELGRYYLNQEVISWRDIDAETVVQRGKRVWFVIIPDMAWVWGNEDFYWWVSHQTELIKVLYLRRADDANLFIYLYDPARHQSDHTGE